MTAADWIRVIDESVDLGVDMVQFIGGKPTLHPDLPQLLRRTVDAGVEVEVFSNLVHVTPEVGVDRLRQVGRGRRAQLPSIVGNVRYQSLTEVLASTAMAETRSTLEQHFAARIKMGRRPCDPQCGPSCGPACNPPCWPTGSGPCAPKGGCQPNYD